jgi:predicted RNase H-like nuclease (RuvC/YqgF family)
MSIVCVITEIYKPVFNENEDNFVDKCPYEKHERNRIHYQCRCKAGTYITSRGEFIQHIKSKTHKTFIENYSAYYKEVDDAEETNKKLTTDNEIMKRKIEMRQKENEQQEKKLISKDEKIAKLMDELTTIKQENNTIEIDNDTLKKQIDSLINGVDGLCKMINNF